VTSAAQSCGKSPSAGPLVAATKRGRSEVRYSSGLIFSSLYVPVFESITAERQPASGWPMDNPLFAPGLLGSDAALDAVPLDEHVTHPGSGVTGQRLPADKRTGGGVAKPTLGNFALGNEFEPLMQRFAYRLAFSLP
jgi:hypothetical protein